MPRAGFALRSINKTVPAFNPAGLSVALHTWYDATQQTTSNGSAVASLTDFSGNSRTATKTAGTLTYATAGLNSKPSFTFTAGAYCTTAAFTSIAGTTPITVFAVAQFTTITSNRSLLSSASGFTLNLGIASPAWTLNRGGATGSGGTADASPHRMRGIYGASGANSTVYIDSVQQITPVNVGSSANTIWRIGSNDSGFQNFAGQISEMLFYAGALTGTEVTNVESYLSAKWGI